MRRHERREVRSHVLGGGIVHEFGGRARGRDGSKRRGLRGWFGFVRPTRTRSHQKHKCQEHGATASRVSTTAIWIEAYSELVRDRARVSAGAPAQLPMPNNVEITSAKSMNQVAPDLERPLLSVSNRARPS